MHVYLFMTRSNTSFLSVITFLIACLLLLAIFKTPPLDEDYSAGRDTHASFVKGRFQICESYGYFIIDMKDQSTLLDNLCDWKCIDSFVYMKNLRNEYLILDCRTSQHDKYNSLFEVPQMHRPNCASLNSKKSY